MCWLLENFALIKFGSLFKNWHSQTNHHHLYLRPPFPDCNPSCKYSLLVLYSKEEVFDLTLWGVDQNYWWWSAISIWAFRVAMTFLASMWPLFEVLRGSDACNEVEDRVSVYLWMAIWVSKWLFVFYRVVFLIPNRTRTFLDVVWHNLINFFIDGLP